MRDIGRRHLLRLLGGLTATGFFAPRSPALGEALDDPAAIAGELGMKLANPRSAALVGAVYLRDRPEECDLRYLCEQLGLGCGDSASAVAERHREDFRRGRVVRLEGFTFSETELRLCALLHLSHS